MPLTPASRRRDHPLVVFFASLLLSLALLGNNVLPFGALGEEGGDYGVIAWDLWFVDHALTRLENPYWTNMIYYPVGTWLAKHTLCAGFFPVTWVVKTLSGASPLYPIYTYRIVILLCFSLALALTYLVLRDLGLPSSVCLAPAVSYAFCRYNHLHIPHIHHLAGAVLLPGVSLALIRLVRDPRTFRAILLAALLAFGVYFTEFIVFVYLGILTASLSALALSPLRSQIGDVLSRLGSRTILLCILLFTLILAPFLAAWIRDVANPPKERQSAVSSANLAGFVIPDPAFTPLYGRLFEETSARVRRGIGGREVFLGFPLVVFGLWGLLARSRTVWVAAALTAVFLILSMGPELKILEENTEFPLPYAWLRRVPPFEMARTPVRFSLVAVYGLAILAGEGLRTARDALRIRFGRWAGATLVTLTLLWSLSEVFLPAPKVAPYVVPPGLGRLVPGAVLNVPISAWDGYAVLLQTFHAHPIATGFVSRGEEEPTDHVKDLDRLLETDPAAFSRRLREEGITNIIVAPQTPPGTLDHLRSVEVNRVDIGG
jgi:hypothetical protein